MKWWFVLSCLPVLFLHFAFTSVQPFATEVSLGDEPCILGRGEMHKVFKIFDEHEFPYAVKARLKSDNDPTSEMQIETKILKLLENQLTKAEKTYFVLPSDAYEKPVHFPVPKDNNELTGVGIVFPFYETSFVHFIEDLPLPDQGTDSHVTILKLLLNIARGLRALLRVGVVHGDIKPNNILLTTSESGEPIPVIIDFEGAGLKGSKDEEIFTDGYVAPERDSKEQALNPMDWQPGALTCKSDMFSFGILALVTLLQFQTDGIPREEALDRLFARKLISFKLKKLLQRSLRPLALMRPDPDEMIDELNQIVISKTRILQCSRDGNVQMLPTLHTQSNLEHSSSSPLSPKETAELRTAEIKREEERKASKEYEQNLFSGNFQAVRTRLAMMQKIESKPSKTRVTQTVSHKAHTTSIAALFIEPSDHSTTKRVQTVAKKTGQRESFRKIEEERNAAENAERDLLSGRTRSINICREHFVK